MKSKLIRSTDKNYVELEVEIVRETPMAILISYDTTEVWIPKSQIEDGPDKQANGLYLIIVPEWLAFDKDLI